mgnify:CR=1 FL=1
MPVRPRHERPEEGKPRMMKWKHVSLSLLICLQAGCLNAKLENSQRLMDRPDFEAAVIAALGWVKDALKTINELEKTHRGGLIACCGLHDAQSAASVQGSLITFPVPITNNHLRWV